MHESRPAPDLDRAALRSAVGGVLFAGFSPLLVRLSPVGPSATVIWRVLLALPATLWLARNDRPMPVRAKLWALLSGFLLAGDLVLWNRSLLMTTILEANVLVMLYPLLVSIGAWLITGERLGGRIGLGGLIAFAGIVVMTAGPSTGTSSMIGNLLAIAAAVFYAGSLLVTARLRQTHAAASVTIWIFIGAALSALPPALLEGPLLAATAPGWGLLILYGVITFFSSFLTNRSLGRLPASLVAIIGYGQPVIATLGAIPLFGEVPTASDAVGAGIVVAGLIIATRPPAKR